MIYNGHIMPIKFFLSLLQDNFKEQFVPIKVLCFQIGLHTLLNLASNIRICFGKSGGDITEPIIYVDYYVQNTMIAFVFKINMLFQL